MGLPDRERSLTISSAIWIHERVGRTDAQTDGHRAIAKSLRIASRGKNDYKHMLEWKRFKCIIVTVMMSDDQQ